MFCLVIPREEPRGKLRDPRWRDTVPGGLTPRATDVCSTGTQEPPPPAPEQLLFLCWVPFHWREGDAGQAGEEAPAHCPLRVPGGEGQGLRTEMWKGDDTVTVTESAPGPGVGVSCHADGEGNVTTWSQGLLSLIPPRHDFSIATCPMAAQPGLPWLHGRSHRQLMASPCFLQGGTPRPGVPGAKATSPWALHARGDASFKTLPQSPWLPCSPTESRAPSATRSDPTAGPPRSCRGSNPDSSA